MSTESQKAASKRYREKMLCSEEYKEKMREHRRRYYEENKEKIKQGRKARKQLEEERKKAFYDSLPRSELYATDCCLICSHFSKVRGLSTGWCLKTKQSADKKDICGFFDPVQKDEEYIWIIEGSR